MIVEDSRKTWRRTLRIRSYLATPVDEDSLTIPHLPTFPASDS